MAWWIDEETGLAISERAGVVRSFVRHGDEVVFDDQADTLRARYLGLEPLSFSFVPARIDDNRELLRRDPGYRARLLALGHVERAPLLEGNWKVRPADVDRLVVNTSVRDALEARREGVYYAVRWEEEPGSAGKRESARLVTLLVEAFAAHGLSVDAAGVRATGDKGTRASSLASTAGVGGVWLVTGAWNEAFLAELHAFPDGAHDDRVDAAAGAFNAVTELDAAGGVSVVNEPEEVVDERGTRAW